MTAWYAVHTIAGHENKVSENLKRLAMHQGLWDTEILDILIPTEKVVRNRGGKRQLVERKVFPGYVWIRMVLTDETQKLIRNTAGVTGFVSSGNKPVPMDDQEVQAILRRLSDSKERPAVVWQRGDTVRILEGPFADFTGKIEEVVPEQEKVKVFITLFGRDTPVELGFGNIEKA
jgi:transcriptional antiterminator NusG